MLAVLIIGSFNLEKTFKIMIESSHKWDMAWTSECHTQPLNVEEHFLDCEKDEAMGRLSEEFFLNVGFIMFGS